MIIIVLVLVATVLGLLWNHYLLKLVKFVIIFKMPWTSWTSFETRKFIAGKGIPAGYPVYISASDGHAYPLGFVDEEDDEDV